MIEEGIVEGIKIGAVILSIILLIIFRIKQSGYKILTTANITNLIGQAFFSIVSIISLVTMLELAWLTWENKLTLEMIQQNKIYLIPLFIIVAFAGLIVYFSILFEKKLTKGIESSNQNVEATIDDKSKEIIIDLDIMHKEEHNLNFGILLNQDLKLGEEPEINCDDDLLTQKEISFSVPHEFVEYRRKKYIQIRLNKPTSILDGDTLRLRISKTKHPRIRVISIIQLQPDGNHIEIFKRDHESIMK